MKMGRALDELQDVVTLRPGQRPGLSRRPLDLVAVARLAAESHAADAGRAIDFRADRDVLVGSWDAARVERVLDNLIGNAVKYSSDQAEVSVAVGLERDERGGWATLTVRDRGPGIAPDDLPHVFDWSRRGRDVVGRLPGSGLGLAIVRQVVEQHGGTVAVSSQPGRGSTFVVRLPLEDGPRPERAALDPSEGSPERSVEWLEDSGSASAAG
jgi:signal transduction histidine kinase